MRICCLMHVPFEDAANIEGWVQHRGHTLQYARLYAGEPLPPLENFDFLAIMGGPMNVYEQDQYPWLRNEVLWIRKSVEANKKVLGVCLGAQLISISLGGIVSPNRYKEIGWHPITMTEEGLSTPLFQGFPKTYMAFHWHGDTFSRPDGAVRLAGSQACEQQGFLYGSHVLALQCHLEYSAQSIRLMLQHGSNELIDSPYVQKAPEIIAGLKNVPQMETFLYMLLDRFTAF